MLFIYLSETMNKYNIRKLFSLWKFPGCSSFFVVVVFESMIKKASSCSVESWSRMLKSILPGIFNIKMFVLYFDILNVINEIDYMLLDTLLVNHLLLLFLLMSLRLAGSTHLWSNILMYIFSYS